MLAKYISASLRGFSRGQAFFDSFGFNFMYGCDHTALLFVVSPFYCFFLFSFCYSLLILLFLSLLILLELFFLFLLFSSYIKLFVVLQKCILNTHWAEVHEKTAKLMVFREKPAKIPVWQKIHQSIPLLI